MSGVTDGSLAEGTSVPLLDLEDLVVDYGTVRALEAERITLAAGSVGLLGSNGAGKSTLLKVILGLLPPTRGGGRVLGQELARNSVAIRGRIGYMSEDDNFLPELSAVEFVSMAGELAGMPPRDALRRTHEVLSYLGLEELRYRKIQGYSTGMKQRLKLAQALVHDPEFLILDEPTNGLDPEGRRSMLELIAALHRRHRKSILLSTHLLEDVDALCESVVILSRGRVVASGPIAALRDRWQNRFRLRLEGAAERFLAAIEAEGVARVLDAPPGPTAGEVVVTTPEGWPTRRFFAILAELESRGELGDLRLHSLRPDQESLDVLFRRLTVDGPAASAAPGEVRDGD